VSVLIASKRSLCAHRSASGLVYWPPLYVSLLCNTYVPTSRPAEHIVKHRARKVMYLLMYFPLHLLCIVPFASLSFREPQMPEIGFREHPFSAIR